MTETEATETNEIPQLQQKVQTLEAKLAELESAGDTALPKTALLSPNYLARAFAVWGHYFVANLIIGLAISIPLLCLMGLLMLFGISLWGGGTSW